MDNRRLNEAELRALIYKERRNLRKNIAEVRAVAKTSATVPRDALIKMREIERTGREKAVRDMTKGELQSYYRDIKYVQNLKTSTLEGALKAEEEWAPVKDLLDTLSEPMQEKFWDIYGKSVGNQNLLYNFKYEIFNALTDMQVLSDDEESIVERISKIFEADYLKFGGEIENEKFRARFRKDLSKKL